jgi:hypothetical protein
MTHLIHELNHVRGRSAALMHPSLFDIGSAHTRRPRSRKDTFTVDFKSSFVRWAIIKHPQCTKGLFAVLCSSGVTLSTSDVDFLSLRPPWLGRRPGIDEGDSQQTLTALSAYVSASFVGHVAELLQNTLQERLHSIAESVL